MNCIYVTRRSANARSPCFFNMELVQLCLKLRPPFVSCPNMPLQCFISHIKLMKYQRSKWTEHSTVVARDLRQKSMELVQLKQSSDHTLLVRRRRTKRRRRC